MWSDVQTHIILISFFHFFLIVNTDHMLLALGEAQGIQMKGAQFLCLRSCVRVGWMALAVNDNYDTTDRGIEEEDSGSAPILVNQLPMPSGQPLLVSNDFSVLFLVCEKCILFLSTSMP